MRAGARSVWAEQGTVDLVCSESLSSTRFHSITHAKGNPMNSIVYLVGAVVIILAILGFLGLR